MGVPQELNIFYLILAGTVIILMLVVSIVIFFYIYQKKIYKQQEEMNSVLIRHQDELLYANWEVIEEERKRLSKEFHDDIGSVFSTISLMLGTLEEQTQYDANIGLVLKQSQQLIDTGIKSMRRILYDIVPPDIDIFGLSNTILILCERISLLSHTDISFHEEGNPSEHFGKRQELTIYRIIQELINNTLKHAGANKVDLKLIWTNKLLSLQYADDGKGFDKEQVNRKGLGIRNIESRAKMINANILFSPNLEKGMSFLLQLPLQSIYE